MPPEDFVIKSIPKTLTILEEELRDKKLDRYVERFFTRFSRIISHRTVVGFTVVDREASKEEDKDA